MSTSLTPEQRYRAKLLRDVEDHPDCIGWSAKIDKYGNAVFTYTVDGRHRDTGAHRFGWELIHGPIPDGHKISNTCGFKACQNMDHWALKDRNLGRSRDEVYLTKFTRLGPNDCWPWQDKARDKNGYGLMSWREGDQTFTTRAHRLGWDLAHPNDVLTDNEIVCHTCDNPPCQNPAHWFKGSYQDNNDDMMKKGRHRVRFGINHWNSKINEDIVREIRSRYAEGGISQQKLADELSLSRSVVRHVLEGRSWKQVD